MRKGFVIFLIILVIGFGLIEIFLPRYYEKLVRDSLQKQMTAVDSLEVQISTHPALLLLTGKVERGNLLARGVQINHLRLNKLEARYVDLTFTQSEQGLKSSGGQNLYFQAEILEEDLNNYLKTTLPQFDLIEVELKADYATLNLRFKDWIDLKLTGTLVVVDKYQIRFVPKEDKNDELPSFLVSQILSFLVFDLGLKELPVPLDLQQIKIVDQRMLALGGTDI